MSKKDVLPMRVNFSEKQTIALAADSLGLATATWCRIILLEAAQKQLESKGIQSPYIDLIKAQIEEEKKKIRRSVRP